MAKFRSLIMANSKIYVFLNNSYYLKMDLNGDIEAIKKNTFKIEQRSNFDKWFFVLSRSKKSIKYF